MQMDLVILDAATICGGGKPLGHALHTAAGSAAETRPAKYSAVLLIEAGDLYTNLSEFYLPRRLCYPSLICALEIRRFSFAAYIINGDHAVLLLGN
jgi:hypothetical protein